MGRTSAAMMTEPAGGLVAAAPATTHRHSDTNGYFGAVVVAVVYTDSPATHVTSPSKLAWSAVRSAFDSILSS